MGDDVKGNAPGLVALDLVGPRALREWITGESEAYSRVFFIDHGASTECVEQVARHDDVVLLPMQGAPYRGPATVVRYDGALFEVGDELFFGERSVELQDYVAAAFVQILGPTVVCFSDESCWRAFLDDADLARHTGVFPLPLIDLRVLVSARRSLAKPGELVMPSAIRVSSDGRVSAGMRGENIGSIDELQTLLTVPLPRATALAGIAPRDAIVSDLTSRKWIERYLNATDLVKMLGLSNGVAKISGFGWLLLDDDLSDAEPLTTDPFLVHAADGFMLADTTTLRRQLLSPVTATAVAAIQTSSTSERAAERIARELGRPHSEAKTLCREAVVALNIHFGMRSDIERRTTGDER